VTVIQCAIRVQLSLMPLAPSSATELLLKGNSIDYVFFTSEMKMIWRIVLLLSLAMTHSAVTSAIDDLSIVLSPEVSFLTSSVTFPSINLSATSAFHVISSSFTAVFDRADHWLSQITELVINSKNDRIFLYFKTAHVLNVSKLNLI
jgi:hypothetical protein